MGGLVFDLPKHLLKPLSNKNSHIQTRSVTALKCGPLSYNLYILHLFFHCISVCACVYVCMWMGVSVRAYREVPQHHTQIKGTASGIIIATFYLVFSK